MIFLIFKPISLGDFIRFALWLKPEHDQEKVRNYKLPKIYNSIFIVTFSTNFPRNVSIPSKKKIFFVSAGP